MIYSVQYLQASGIINGMHTMIAIPTVGDMQIKYPTFIKDSSILPVRFIAK